MTPRRRREARRDAPTEEFDDLVALYRSVVEQIRTDYSLQLRIKTLGLTDRGFADRWVLGRGVHLDHYGDPVKTRSDATDLAYEMATNPRG